LLRLLGEVVTGQEQGVVLLWLFCDELVPLVVLGLVIEEPSPSQGLADPFGVLGEGEVVLDGPITRRLA
jgi:hypothetical protein